MFDLDRWQEIFSSLKHNKLRTFLTVFGVFWGIFMLMIMLGSSSGLTNGVTEEMEGFATNSAFVWTQRTTLPYKGFQRGRRWNFTNDDMTDIRNNIREINVLAPKLNGWGGDGANNAIRGIKSGAFSISGDYPEVNKIDPVIMVKGRFLNNIDISEKRKIAVIGNHVFDVLFEQDEDPIGKYIKIKNVYFKVVGVFKPKNPNINMGGGGKDQTIFLPFTTLQQIYNFGNIVHHFAITAKDGIPVSQIEDKVVTLLKKRHKISPDDEQAVGHVNIEKEIKKITILFTGMHFLIWIVGIGTLLAGVIGVSNIMLVIVKERTKEIGIQRAIGATPNKIIGQIITESVFLTTLAGYSGLVVGVGIIQAINLILIKSGTESVFKNPGIDFNIAIISLIIIISSGVFAGLLPAYRAMKIKPIDALRSE